MLGTVLRALEMLTKGAGVVDPQLRVLAALPGDPGVIPNLKTPAPGYPTPSPGFLGYQAHVWRVYM